MRQITRKAIIVFLTVAMIFLSLPLQTIAQTRQEKRDRAMEDLQKRFEWWPTDAAPGPVEDKEHGGYWWWPKEPGKTQLWGNRGHIYVNKILTENKQEKFIPVEVTAPVAEKGPSTSLLIKKVKKNVKVYFDYNKAVLRPDHTPILEDAVRILQNSPECDILITGSCDKRGSDKYNIRLGEKRAEAVRQFMIKEGIEDAKIRIISRGKLDALASLTDLFGMQRDRNAHFVIAEVEEVSIPYSKDAPDEKAVSLGKGRFLIEEEKELESGLSVTTKNYTIKKNDTLWKIAKKEMGSGYRWQYLYQINKDRIKNPGILPVGSVITIPVE